MGQALVEAVLRGGYPQAVARTTARRCAAWAHQYVDAIIQRDVRDVASIEKLQQLPRFLNALALVSGQIKMGAVLYDGTDTMPMGKGLWVAPLSSLWGI